MLPVTIKDVPAGSSSQLDTNEIDGVVDSKKGGKPSLAERNRERQQRFRQRQKSRIEELETRCQRLTSQARALATEKDELANSVSLLKNLVQVRDLQLVAVTSQLAQQLPSGAPVKLELPNLEALGSLDALLHQQPSLALDAIQSARIEAQAEVAQLQTRVPDEAVREGPSSTDTQVHESIFPRQMSSPVSEAGGQPTSAHSPQLALDQLCRVAEIAELQQAELSSPGSGLDDEREASGTSGDSIEPPIQATSHLSSNFDQTADVLLSVEGNRLLVHSAFLAAHSDYFAQKFADLRHSQPLFSSPQEPLVMDAGLPGKRFQDVLLFVSHCYGVLDLAPVADMDVMRLIMVADELGSKRLLQLCDDAIVERATGKRFSYFVGLSQGGDVVDWIRLADRLGLKRVSEVCETHLAHYLKENRTWRENTRLNELGQDCLLRVINKLAEL